jgi:hypothetical protein
MSDWSVADRREEPPTRHLSFWVTTDIAGEHARDAICE